MVNRMRVLVGMLLLVGSLGQTAFGGGLKLKEGSRLTYWVDYYGEQYDFIVTVKEIGEEGIKFDYRMTKLGTKGSVEITKGALNQALGQENTFRGGELVLSSKTTVWISRLVYSSLKGEGKVNVDVGEGTETLVLKGKEKFEVEVDGKVKKMGVLLAETSEGKKFTITDDKKFPLILKMDLGWLIGIKSINK